MNVTGRNFAGFTFRIFVQKGFKVHTNEYQISTQKKTLCGGFDIALFFI